MLSLEQLSDQLTLQQLVIAYANAIDERDFEGLDRVFTPDAYIDYRSMGGIDGRYPAIKPWLIEALGRFDGYMHLVGNCAFEIAGDRAQGKAACFNAMEIKRPDGSGTDVMFLGLWYLDRFVRTNEGWRISERIERASFRHNFPAWLAQKLSATGRQPTAGRGSSP